MVTTHEELTEIINTYRKDCFNYIKMRIPTLFSMYKDDIWQETNIVILRYFNKGILEQKNAKHLFLSIIYRMCLHYSKDHKHRNQYVGSIDSLKVDRLFNLKSYNNGPFLYDIKVYKNHERLQKLKKIETSKQSTKHGVWKPVIEEVDSHIIEYPNMKAVKAFHGMSHRRLVRSINNGTPIEDSLFKYKEDANMASNM